MTHVQSARVAAPLGLLLIFAVACGHDDGDMEVTVDPSGTLWAKQQAADAQMLDNDCIQECVNAINQTRGGLLDEFNECQMGSPNHEAFMDCLSETCPIVCTGDQIGECAEPHSDISDCFDDFESEWDQSGDDYRKCIADCRD